MTPEKVLRNEGADYLRIFTKQGRGGGGGQAIGLFIGAMWRKDEVPDIRANWPHIICKGSSDPWTCRRIGESIGLKS